MIAARPLRQLARLTPGEWFLFGEALLTLAWATVAIRFTPFKRVVRAAGRPLTRCAPLAASPDQLTKLHRAVDAVSRRVPWKAVCFQRGLALHMMLRRRGHGSLLHYGVAQAHEAVTAHVWVSLDGQILIGGEQAPQFRLVATFPAPLVQPVPA